jgi:site-specific DNA recombinase
LEDFVVEQLRSLGGDEALLAGSVRRAQERLRERAAEAEAEQARTRSALEERRAELQALIATGADRNGSAARAAALREVIRSLDADARRLDARIAAMRDRVLDEDELAGALEAFDPMWAALSSAERERLVQLLVRSVEYDAASEAISVTFHALEDEEAQPCPA